MPGKLGRFDFSGQPGTSLACRDRRHREQPPCLAVLPDSGLQALEVESGIVQNPNDDAQQEIAFAQDDPQQEITAAQNDTRLRCPEEEAVQSSE